MKRSLIALALIASTGTARAQGGWPATFTPAVVASYVDRHGGLLVAASGGTASERAADVLRRALRQAGAATVVMDAGAIGATAGIDDQAIVKRAAALPLDEIAIVRVFPGDADVEVAVVTFYDRAGTVLAAFTAEAGAPLTARAGEIAGGGLSRAASETVGGILKYPGAALPNTAEEEYDLRYVGSFSADGNPRKWVMSDWYEGKHGKRPLGYSELFNKVGREDLHNDFRASVDNRTRSWNAGFVLLVFGAPLGLLTAAIALPITAGLCAHDAPNCPGFWGALGVTSALVGAGLLAGIPLMIFGHTAAGSPISHDDERALVDEYNRSLRKRLGLSAARPTPPKLTMSLQPFFGAQGGGLGLSGAFQ
jgi:hypothetical protein